jgi:glycosyltransferase involved in cell wall biosynthesis
MIDITVAICTYNGEKRLPDVLERLRSQINIEPISWEIVVIDNNSTDDTAKIIQKYQSDWHKAYPIQYYFEPEQGLAFARQRAVKEAKGTFVGFLDDDNLPSPNWVAAAYTFGQAYPKAGAYGSKINGSFEIEPPENFSRIARFLAIGGGKKTTCYTSYEHSYKRVMPAGAGLVIRKQAWINSVPERLLLQGQLGTYRLGGDDIEALLHIRSAGWEIWYNPEMCIEHRIPKQRLEREYLMNLLRGAGLSRYPTRMLGLKPWQRPFVLPVYMLNDLRKIILHFIKYQSILKTDAVAASEMELFLGSLMSPFYFWRQGFFRMK